MCGKYITAASVLLYSARKHTQTHSDPKALYSCRPNAFQPLIFLICQTSETAIRFASERIKEAKYAQHFIRFLLLFYLYAIRLNVCVCVRARVYIFHMLNVALCALFFFHHRSSSLLPSFSLSHRSHWNAHSFFSLVCCVVAVAVWGPHKNDFRYRFRVHCVCACVLPQIHY